MYQILIVVGGDGCWIHCGCSVELQVVILIVVGLEVLPSVYQNLIVVGVDGSWIHGHVEPPRDQFFQQSTTYLYLYTYQIKYKLCGWFFPLPDRVGKEGHPPSPLPQSLN